MEKNRKKVLTLVLSLVFLTLLLAGAVPLQAAPADVVNFTDANLERAVRDALDKPSGDITEADMATLTELSADLMGIASLSGLEKAVNLQELSLAFNQISDITPLTNLIKLEELGLMLNNHISDITPLTNLTNLSVLYLDFNDISDISTLSNLDNLESLSLGGNLIADISPLANLANLTELELAYNKIAAIPDLDLNLTSLEVLGLSFNKITDISKLSRLNAPHLSSLNLSGNIIVNISSLSKFTGLEELLLSQNRISNLSSLTGLKKLEWLALDSNQISSISTLVDQNTGLGADDFITLQKNALNLSLGSDAYNHVLKLMKRGADVYTDAPAVDFTDPDEYYNDEVPLDTEITVYFSNVVLKGSTFDKITLKAGSTSVSVAKNLVNLGEEGTILIITPNDMLKDCTTYTVTIPAGAVKVNNNNVLIGDYKFSFETEDITPPTGSITGPSYAAATPVTLTLSATDNSRTVAKMRFSNDGGYTWSQWETYASKKSWKIPSGDGKKTVTVQFRDPTGNVSKPKSSTIVLDTRKPAVTLYAPVYSTDISRTATFNLFWKATDPAPSAGMASYDIFYKTGLTGTWIKLKTITQKADNFEGKPGNAYYFKIVARDRAGNAVVSNTAKTIVPYDNDGLGFTRLGFGETVTGSSRYYMGTVRYSTTADESITYKFTGNSIALLATRGPACSKARIFIDGKAITTIDTYAKEFQYSKPVFSYNFGTNSGAHTIKIVNLATPDRPYFVIDGLAVGK